MEDNLQDWLKTERGKIIKNIDKQMFDEVKGCFESGHLRAAYIMGWIAIVECLKRKIIEFADLGDANSTQAVQEIESLEKNHKSADKRIFEQAITCGIIASNDASTINHLWQQRCIFAHPYEQKPDKEKLKYLISQGIAITMGKELTYNKPYLEEICNNLVNKPFILSDATDEIREEAKRILNRTPNKLLPFLFKTLLFKIGQLIDDESQTMTIKKLRFFIIEIFIKTEKSLSSSDWGLKKRATDYPYCSILGYVHPEIWDKIPDEIKNLLFSYFEEAREIDQRKKNNMRFVFKALSERGILDTGYSQRFMDYLNGLSFSIAINLYGNTKQMFERVKMSMKTTDFYIQNEVIDFLESSKRAAQISALDNVFQKELGQLISSASRSNHFKSKYFINSILRKQYGYSDYIRGGIALGKVLSSYHASLDWWQIPEAVNILNKLDESVQEDIYQAFIDCNASVQKPEGSSPNRLIEIFKQVEDNIALKSESKMLFENFTDAIIASYP